jgi:cobalt-zinc-cadmium efflux system outer membrane protein
MSRTSWASAVLVALATSTPSSAQILSEQQFLEDVLKAHPVIAAAEASVAAAEGSRRQAGLVANPALSWEREDPGDAPRQDTWRLDWRLPFDGRKHRVAAAGASLDAASSGLEATRLDVRIEMESRFAAWYLAVEREEVLRAHLERAQRLAAWLRARAEEGEAAGVEAQRLELEVEILERDVAAARADAQAQRALTAAWSDLVTGDVRPGRPLLSPPPSAFDVAGNPELEVLAHRVVESEAEYRLQRRVLDPPEIGVGWMELRDGRQSFDGPVFGVAWPIPIFDRRQGNREAARAETERARKTLEAATRRINASARAALAAYSDLYRAATSASTGSTDSEVVVAVFAAFEAGEAGLTDVLDALRSSVDVQLARLESIDRALEAQRELETALGRPVLPGGN